MNSHGLTRIELDDEVLFDRAIDVLAGRHRSHGAGEILGVKGEPLRGHNAGALAQRLEGSLLAGTLAQGDHVADLHGVGGDVHLLAVDQDVAVHDDLARHAAGLGNAQTIDHVVKAQLEELVGILLDNACKYAAPESVISVRLTRQERSVHLAVHNKGDAFDGDALAHLFERFYRLDQSRTRQTGGYGLGLAIVKKTVELLGGKISFVSREGEGTTFTVTLPLAVNTSYHAPAPEPEPGARLDGVRILMAEDNALNREIATYMFEERGALVTAAEDGQQAVDRFAASAPSSFDIILMDIMMPVLDGLDAARAIRVLDRTDARTVPILAVSANAFSDDIAASREAGMNGHLSKPLDFDRVAAVIAQYIRRS